MKNYFFLCTFWLLNFNSIVIAQNEIPINSWNHSVSFDTGLSRIQYKTINQKNEVNYKLFSSLKYQLSRTNNKSKLEPFVACNYGTNSINGTFSKSWNYSIKRYSYISIKLGLAIKLNQNWRIESNIGIPILKLFDSSVLGETNNNAILILFNKQNETIFYPEIEINNMFIIESNISRKIYKGLSGYTSLRYFIVQTSPIIPFYKIRQTLYLQMGVSYTF